MDTTTNQTAPDELQFRVRRREVARQDALADNWGCLVPLQGEFTLLCESIVMIVFIIQFGSFHLRLLHLVDSNVREEVNLDIFRHRLGFENHVVVPQ